MIKLSVLISKSIKFIKEHHHAHKQILKPRHLDGSQAVCVLEGGEHTAAVGQGQWA